MKILANTVNTSYGNLLCYHLLRQSNQNNHHLFSKNAILPVL